jgi:hypothetical protein
VAIHIADGTNVNNRPKPTSIEIPLIRKISPIADNPKTRKNAVTGTMILRALIG